MHKLSTPPPPPLHISQNSGFASEGKENLYRGVCPDDKHVCAAEVDHAVAGAEQAEVGVETKNRVNESLTAQALKLPRVLAVSYPSKPPFHALQDPSILLIESFFALQIS